MDIIWHGHSFFEIGVKSPNDSNQKIKIAIDPFDKNIGIYPKRVLADILLISHYHYDHSNKDAVKGDYFIIDQPGQYEVKNIMIKGVNSFHDNKLGQERGLNVFYIIQAEDIKICHLGDFGQSEFSTEQKKELIDIDILMLPVGGVFTISGEKAAKLVFEIEPKIVIPMHYKIPGLNLKINDEKEFLSRIEIEPKNVDKLKIRKSDLPKDKIEVYILKPQ